MAGFQTSRVHSFVPLVAVLASGCFGSEPPTDQATPGMNGRGEFFRWDTLDDPAVQTLAPLAVGAAAFVGHSSGGCVESLLPSLADSSCGRITGRATGRALLAAFESGNRLVDWVVVDVLVPDGFAIRLPGWGFPADWSSTSLVIPFGEWRDMVLELEADGTALMGDAAWAASVEPAGALHVEGYGRYVRVDCLWTGPAELTIHESVSGTTQARTVDCLDPPWTGETAP